MKRLLVVPLLVTFAFGGTITPIPSETEKKIKQAVESREYTTAVTELEKLRAVDEKAFLIADYDYLLARMAESSGNLAVAMANYQAVATRNSVLAPYALKHLSQIARSTGNLILERIYLSEMQAVSQDGLDAKSVTLRLARNSFESGDYSKTVGILTSVQDNTGANKASANPGLREAKALLAEALLRSGQVERAREIFGNLLDSVPNAAQPDDISLSAAKGLDLLDVGSENAGKRVASLAESEHLRRGNIYQFNRDFPDARLHFLALIAGYQSGVNSADAAFQVGRGYAQEGDFVEALKWFERVMEQYPQSPAAKDALLQAASAYGRVGKPKEAVKRYQSFIEKFPTDEKLDRAYMNIVDIHRDQGEDTEALKWCGKAREAFKGKLPEAIAVFTEARIHFAREEWQNALDSLERLKPFTDLGGATVPGGTSVEEVIFLKGFVLENLKKYPEAIESYLSVPDGRGEYYGWLASERLKLISQNETGRSHIGQSIGLLSAGLKKDPDTRRKNAVSILRLTDNADLRKKTLEELKLAIKASPKYSNPEPISP